MFKTMLLAMFPWLIFFRNEQEEHGDADDVEVTHYQPQRGNLLPTAVIPEYEWKVPEPLETVTVYIKRTYPDDYTSRWVAGRDKNGDYHSVKLNQIPAVSFLGSTEEYERWLRIMSSKGFR